MSKITIGIKRPKKKKPERKDLDYGWKEIDEGICDKYEKDLHRHDHLMDAMRYKFDSTVSEMNEYDTHIFIETNNLEEQLDKAIDAHRFKAKLIIVPEGFMNKVWKELHRTAMLFNTGGKSLGKSSSCSNITYRGIRVFETRNIAKNEIIIF